MYDMTINEWTETSRYDSLRLYTYDSERLEVTLICHDVRYISYAPGNMAVDPDGGPYIGRGTRLYPPPPHSGLRIVRINKEKYDHAKKCLTVCVTVEEVGEEAQGAKGAQ